MRKHKSVVAILLAVMMIFTFMPAMAFAETTASDKAVWNDTFTEVTKDGTTYTASHSAWTTGSGMQVATCDYSAADVDDFYYYDLKGATIDVAKNVPLATYKQLLSDGTVTVTIHTKDSNGNNVSGNVHTGSWTAKVTGEKIDELKGNKKVTLTVEFTAAVDGKSMDGHSFDTPILVNTPLTQEVNVIGTAATPVNGTYYVDGDTTKQAATSVPYDGKEHTFELAPADNYTVSYEKYNASTGKWEAVDSITVKEVADTQYDLFRGVYKDSKGEVFGEPGTIRPAVTPATAPTIAWSKDNAARPYNYEITQAQAENPWAFIEMTTKASSDEEALMAYLQARYQFKVRKSVADENVQSWRIEDSDAYTADPTAFEKQYDSLFKNYTGRFSLSDMGSKQVHIVSDPVVEQSDDVTFTVAQGQTWKAKQLKKKAKTFKVKAVADSGKTVKYYIVSSNTKKITINNTTGKVTVKKGLKKGTYTIVVKAKTVAGDGFKAASEKATIKVKVTKK